MPSLVILTAGENNGCLQAEALRQLRGEKQKRAGYTKPRLQTCGRIARLYLAVDSADDRGSRGSPSRTDRESPTAGANNARSS